MKHLIIQLMVILNCITFSSCITKYETKGINEIADILVVQGIITDEESSISLTRSVLLTGDYTPASIDNATVYVECDDGTRTLSAIYEPTDVYPYIGRYVINTGQLNPDRKYCLKVEVDNHVYASEFTHPIKTPEIDSVFWTKRAQGQPVRISVSTQSQNNDVLYYQWSFREDWEHHSSYQLLQCPACDLFWKLGSPPYCYLCDVLLEPSPFSYYCWRYVNSRDILLGSSAKTIFGQVTENIFEIDPSERRLSVLYRITVNQNAISKRAHDYFANIKKNAENMGSIFAPVPSELRGNIICTTDPGRQVIGYIDISTTTQKSLFIHSGDVFEPTMKLNPDSELYETWNWCFPIQPYTSPELIVHFMYINEEGKPRSVSVNIDCVDCDGLTQKPDGWPEIIYDSMGNIIGYIY